MLRGLTLLLVSIVVLSAKAQEICDNGTDDNGDGLVDLNDPLCACNGMLIIPASLISNPSFEDTLCCPNWNGQISCANNWQQSSFISSADFFHTCNFMPVSITDAGLTPFADGEACAGMIVLSDYKEYILTCLDSPMLSGTSYTLQLQIASMEVDDFLNTCPAAPTDYPPFDLTVFGAPTCGNFPVSGMDCPSAPFVPIGSVSYDPFSGWQTITMSFTPAFNVAEIIIGPSCTLPPDYPAHMNTPACYPYLLLDNLIVNTTSAFNVFNIELWGSLCDNNAVLSVSPVLTGGAWQWYEDGIAIVGQTNPTLNISDLALGGGNYTATFNGADGCASDSLNLPDAEPFSISVNSDTICEGSSALLTVTGTTGSCTWSPTTELNASTGLSVQASPEQTTSYTVTATANGCVATAVSTVIVTPGIDVEVNDVTICPGESAELIATGASNYTWSPSTGLNATTGASVIATVNTTTTYTVTGTTNDCAAGGQGTVTIDNSIPMSISASPNPVSADNPLVHLHGEPANADLSWTLNGTTASGSAITYEFPAVGNTYDVLLIAHTDEGCIDSMHITIVVESGLTFYVPNAFTPDGNEHNNIFLPVFSTGFDPSDYELMIFNRWGETVFQTKDIAAGWDGSYNGYYVPEGQYSWTIIVKRDKSDERSKFSGHLNLLR